MKRNKLRFSIVVLTAIAAFLAGCGSDGNNSTQSSSESSAQSSSSTAFTPPADNSNEPQNAYGYYGEHAKLGELQLVGEWEYRDANMSEDDYFALLLRKDGTFTTKSTAMGDQGYYGADLNGTVLTIDTPARTNGYVKLFIDDNISSHCFNTTLVREDNVTKACMLCRKDTNTDALINGINVGKSFGPSGYYGDDVMFGDHNITGTWFRYHNVDSPTFGEIFYLESNGSVIIHHDSGNGQADSLANYGTNEDGSILYILNTPHQIVRQDDNSCYETIDDNENTFLLCKESNETQH